VGFFFVAWITISDPATWTNKRQVLLMTTIDDFMLVQTMLEVNNEHVGGIA
jgi:hypothetical protein